MNLKETNTALALVQAFDRRTVGEVDVRAWQSVLGDLEVADVAEAVRRHYADSSDWMMPAHVRRGVAEIVAERNRPEPSPWAPGQYGVLREDAVAIVEGQTGERLALSELPAAVADLVARVRAGLPESSREALRPRTVAWEREQAAYRRSQGGEPNPHYRPKVSEHAAEDPDQVEALRESDGFCVGGESCTHGGHQGATARGGEHECLIKDGRCLAPGHVDAVRCALCMESAKDLRAHMNVKHRMA